MKFINFKKVRLCNKTDFENVNYIEGFEEIPENNFDYCIDDYKGMIIKNNINSLISDSLLF